MLDNLPVIQKEIIYKKIGDVELQMHLFEPENREEGKLLPVVVFFFGGGWNKGTPKQFFPHCTYFASRGMVAISAEYRVKSRHGTSPLECVLDGKSAVRWIRLHSSELGVDPDKITAGGGSAGGHVAACTAIVEKFEGKTEDTDISSVPNALMLFNPVVDTARKELSDRFGEYAEDLSPVHHVRSGLPPAIIFHGKDDSVVPFRNIERFGRLMKKLGNVCTIVPFDGMEHGFFNYGRHDNKPFVETVRAADRFLVSLGFLKGESLL